MKLALVKALGSSQAGTALCLALGLLGCESRPRPEPSTERLAAEVPSKAKAVAAPVAVLDVGNAYKAIDSVGAKRRIRLEPTSASLAHSPPEAWKLSFEKDGSFAGVCWKNRAGNEGEAPGDDLSGARYRRIVFWARGEKGGEVAEFRAGGLGHLKTRYRETFDVTAGKVKLGTSWSEHSIYVSDVDLSSVMTPFCALFHQEDNPEGATIFLDDIQYRG